MKNVFFRTLFLIPILFFIDIAQAGRAGRAIPRTPNACSTLVNNGERRFHEGSPSEDLQRTINRLKSGYAHYDGVTRQYRVKWFQCPRYQGEGRNLIANVLDPGRNEMSPTQCAVRALEGLRDECAPPLSVNIVQVDVSSITSFDFRVNTSFMGTNPPCIYCFEPVPENTANGEAATTEDPPVTGQTPRRPRGHIANETVSAPTLCELIGRGNDPACNDGEAMRFIGRFCPGVQANPGVTDSLPPGCNVTQQCEQRKADNHAELIARQVSCTTVSVGQLEEEIRQGEDDRARAQAALADVERKCSPAHQSAERCCLDPLYCVSSGRASSRDPASAQAFAREVIGDMGAQNNVASICSTQGNLAMLSSAINAYSTDKCDELRQVCSSECQQARQQVQTVNTTCSSDAGACRLAQSQGLVAALQSTESHRSDCISGRLADASHALSDQAMSDVQQNIQAQMCSNEATAQVAGFDTFNPNASLPQNQVPAAPAPVGNSSRATVDLGGLNSDGTADLDGAVTARGGPSTGSGLAVPTLSASRELEGAATAPQDAAGVKPAAVAAAVSSGGSSGGSASLSSGYGRRQAAPVAGVQQSNYNTQVGSLDAGGGDGGGSGGGYVPRPRMPNMDLFKDLKKMLPGYDKSPSRQIAGLGAPRATTANAPSLGHVHEDIFTKMTRAFAKQCVQSSLLDCQLNTRDGR